MPIRQVQYGVSSGTAASSAAALTDYQTVAPTSGQTVVMTDNSLDGVLYLTPSGLLALLNITMPSNANSRLGQVRRVVTTQTITALNLLGGTLLNAPTSILANTGVTFVRVNATTWAAIL